MILKNSPLPPSFTFVSMQDLHEDEKIVAKLTRYFGEDHDKWPKAIRDLIFKED